MLEPALAEIETHVHAAGWDRPPSLFALVRAGTFLADDPETAHRVGLDLVPPDTLSPVEQEGLPEGSLDEILAHIAWPDSVAGCAVSQEIVVLPPSVEAELADEPSIEEAAAHPERREARIVVGVLRDGSSAALLRLRPRGDADEAVLTGPDLAPNLVQALLATLAD